jgi:hypothetical protein
MRGIRPSVRACSGEVGTGSPKRTCAKIDAERVLLLGA